MCHWCIEKCRRHPDNRRIIYHFCYTKCTKINCIRNYDIVLSREKCLMNMIRFIIEKSFTSTRYLKHDELFLMIKVDQFPDDLFSNIIFTVLTSCAMTRNHVRSKPFSSCHGISDISDRNLSKLVSLIG
jgi:hypothetical protein